MSKIAERVAPFSLANVKLSLFVSEHRYGREEMLALFNTFKVVPEELYDYPTILSEESLKPVSFLPFSGT